MLLCGGCGPQDPGPYSYDQLPEQDVLPQLDGGCGARSHRTGSPAPSTAPTRPNPRTLTAAPNDDAAVLIADCDARLAPTAPLPTPLENRHRRRLDRVGQRPRVAAVSRTITTSRAGGPAEPGGIERLVGDFDGSAGHQPGEPADKAELYGRLHTACRAWPGRTGEVV